MKVLSKLFNHLGSTTNIDIVDIKERNILPNPRTKQYPGDQVIFDIPQWDGPNVYFLDKAYITIGVQVLLADGSPIPPSPKPSNENEGENEDEYADEDVPLSVLRQKRNRGFEDDSFPSTSSYRGGKTGGAKGGKGGPFKGSKGNRGGGKVPSKRGRGRGGRRRRGVTQRENGTGGGYGPAPDVPIPVVPAQENTANFALANNCMNSLFNDITLVIGDNSLQVKSILQTQNDGN